MGLSNTEFAKKASKGPYAGKARKDIANIKIKNRKPFTIEKTGEKIIGLKVSGNNLIYKVKNSEKTIPFSNIQKDEDFGGQPAKKGSGSSAAISGKIVEVLSEAFFCIYCAMKSAGTLSKYDKDKTYEDWDDIQSVKDISNFASTYKISKYVDQELKSSVFNQYKKFANAFLVDKEWHARLMAQVNVMYSNYPIPNKSFTFLRADNMKRSMDPYKTFEVVAQQIKSKTGFSRPVDKDKWNPADVWFFTSSAENTLTKELKELESKINKNPANAVDQLNNLNQLIFKLFEKKELYPISLKAPAGTSARITAVNEDGDIEQLVKFDRIDLGQGNLDVKIRFDLIYQKKKTKKLVKKMTGYLKSKTDTGGFRLELEFPGSGARFGTLGTENYQYIIYNTDKSGINALQRIRKQSNTFQQIPEKYKPGTGELDWLGASGYQKLSKEKGSRDYLEGYLQTLFNKINNEKFRLGQPPEKNVLNKTIASEIAVAINEIKNKVAREITVENIYNLAVSQGFRVGISKEQLKARGEKSIVDKTVADTLFDSCFHLKVY